MSEKEENMQYACNMADGIFDYLTKNSKEFNQWLESMEEPVLLNFYRRINEATYYCIFGKRASYKGWHISEEEMLKQTKVGV